MNARTCEHCGRSYSPTSYCQRYCCAACRNAEKRRSIATKRAYNKTSAGANMHAISLAADAARRRGLTYGRMRAEEYAAGSARIRWYEYMRDCGGQPSRCIHSVESTCGYPIEDCPNCPIFPGNSDLDWGATICSVQ